MEAAFAIDNPLLEADVASICVALYEGGQTTPFYRITARN